MLTLPTLAEIDAALVHRQLGHRLTLRDGTLDIAPIGYGKAASSLAADPDDLPELVRLAARLEPGLRARFLDAVKATQARMRAVPDVGRLETVADIDRALKALGVGEVSLGNLSVEHGRILVGRLLETEYLPTRIEASVLGLGGTGDPLAIVQGGTTLRLSAALDTPESLTTALAKLPRDWFAEPSFQGIVDHELGHVLQPHLRLMDLPPRVDDILRDPMLQISEYAGTTPHVGERFAEFFARYRAGGEVPAPLRELFEQHGVLASPEKITAIERALFNGDTQGAERLLSGLPKDLQAAIKPVLQTGYIQGAQAANVNLINAGIGVRFDLINPLAVQWAERQAANLVVQITTSTRDAIRTIITESVSGGDDVRRTARAIADIVGLDPRRASAVAAFQDRLEAQGAGGDILERRVAKYAAAQLRDRGTVIARTETLTAENQGQRALWQEATRQGLLDPETTQRIFITTDDDRRDEECEALDGETVGLDESFPSGDPPIHPQCRCTTGLVFER